MAEGPRKILVCSCEDTMPLDVQAVRKVCRGAEVMTGRHLCRSELARVQNAFAGEDPVTVACTQEAPLFKELAADAGDAQAAGVSFVNIRETAGWSNEANDAGPKMAALIAASLEPAPGPAAPVSPVAARR